VLTLLLRQGDAAPGCQPSVTLGGGSVSMLTHSFNTNRVGRAAFFARIGGGSVPTTEALFSTRFGLVWPEIMPGTTTSDGREFGVVSSPRLSDNGRLAVLANLRSAQTWSPMGVWSSAGGGWQPVIEPGDAVPDRPGVTITGASFIHGHAADGTIVFTANITRANGAFGNALFQSTLTGGVTTIAMDGDVVHVPGVGAKTVWAVNADMDAVSDTGIAAFRLHFTDGTTGHFTTGPEMCSPDFDGDGDSGTDADIEAFFACLAGNCCAGCGSADFNADGDSGTDADIEAFFRTLSGGSC
jgi:hypothetical protein